MQVTITIDQDEGGMWVVTSPDVPIMRVVDRDQTVAVTRAIGALEAIRDAIAGRTSAIPGQSFFGGGGGGSGRPIR